MPNIVPIESLKNSLQIGASQVAAILHFDPWKSSFELFQEKSGRRPKPPQTDAMRFGLEMESRAMQAYYRDKGCEPMQEQVCALHPTKDFLCAVVDGWNGTTGVNVKTPSSEKVIEQAEFGIVPRHYLLQLAMEMSVFEAETWDYCVYVADGSGTFIIPVDWDYPWYGSETLREFWEKTAMPEIEKFYNSLESGEEFGAREQTPLPDSSEWINACQNYRDMKKSIEGLEQEAEYWKAKIKTMAGNRRFVSLAGFKADNQVVKPTFALKVLVDCRERIEEIRNVLEPLSNAEGVRGIEDAIREESRRFVVKPISAKESAM